MAWWSIAGGMQATGTAERNATLVMAEAVLGRHRQRRREPERIAIRPMDPVPCLQPHTTERNAACNGLGNGSKTVRVFQATAAARNERLSPIDPAHP
jgi:hypothetical protein